MTAVGRGMDGYLFLEVRRRCHPRPAAGSATLQSVGAYRDGVAESVSGEHPGPYRGSSSTEVP